MIEREEVLPFVERDVLKDDPLREKRAKLLLLLLLLLLLRKDKEEEEREEEELGGGGRGWEKYGSQRELERWTRMSISITSLSSTVAFTRGEEEVVKEEASGQRLLRLLEGEELQEGVAFRREESAL